MTRLLPELALDLNRDQVKEKTRPSCFAGTDLAGRWRKAAVNELVIVRVKTEFCVDTTCRAAAELGFKVVLVEDTHTTMHTPVLQADAIIAHHNRTLNGPFLQGVLTSNGEF